MQLHWHASVENVLLYGISAIIVINLVRIGGGMLVQHERTERIGNALVALV